jgi:hypothetical protein
VLQRIAVNRFVDSAVDAEIGLTVAVQIQLAQCDAVLDRFLIDGRRYISSVPAQLAWKPDIH